eukprot:gene27395-27655_t
MDPSGGTLGTEVVGWSIPAPILGDWHDNTTEALASPPGKSPIARFPCHPGHDPFYGKLKIAQVAPLYEAVPPLLYGGTERVVAYLTDALVELGHDVTLFASGESKTLATLCPGRDQAIRLDPAGLKSDLAAHMAMLSELRRRAHEFDLIHFHTDMIQF